MRTSAFDTDSPARRLQSSRSLLRWTRMATILPLAGSSPSTKPSPYHYAASPRTTICSSAAQNRYAQPQLAAAPQGSPADPTPASVTSSRSINRNMRSLRRRPRFMPYNPSLNKISRPNTRSPTRPNTPLRSSLMRSSRNTPAALRRSAAEHRAAPQYSHQTRANRRPHKRSAPKISSNY